MENGLTIINDKTIYQNVKNGIIDHIECYFDKKRVRVIYETGKITDLLFDIGVYNSQFNNVPLSSSRNWIFWSSWDKGISAFDLITGNMVWNKKGCKYRKILVFDDYIISLQQYNRLVKIKIENGSDLNEIKTGTINGIYKLDNQYIAADSIRGKLTIYDTRDMSVLKEYPKSIYKQQYDDGDYYFTIRDLWIENNSLLAEGFFSSMAINSNTTFNETLKIDKQFFAI